MHEHELKFRAYLEKKGLKYTSPRRHILDAVFALHEHFNAEELYYRIKNVSQGISLASVYRTLPLLVDAGLVQHAVRSAGRERYEHIYGHPKHIHWLCRICGSVIETDLQPITPVISQLARRMQFLDEEIELSIKGLCWKCQQSENENQIDER